jgi:hypothetical protein
MSIPEEIKISLLCLFCNAPLEGENGKEFSSGDMIKCLQCNELNDYDSIIELAKEKGIKELEKHVQNDLKKRFGNILK